jgi:hypothetical protein
MAECETAYLRIRRVNYFDDVASLADLRAATL